MWKFKKQPREQSKPSVKFSASPQQSESRVDKDRSNQRIESRTNSLERRWIIVGRVDVNSWLTLNHRNERWRGACIEASRDTASRVEQKERCGLRASFYYWQSVLRLLMVSSIVRFVKEIGRETGNSEDDDWEIRQRQKEKNLETEREKSGDRKRKMKRWKERNKQIEKEK